MEIEKQNKSDTYLFYDVEIRQVEYQWQQPRQSHVQEWRLDGVHAHSETKRMMFYQHVYLWLK